MVHLSHPYMTTGKTMALTIQSFVGKVTSLLFNMSMGFSRQRYWSGLPFPSPVVHFSILASRTQWIVWKVKHYYLLIRTSWNVQNFKITVGQRQTLQVGGEVNFLIGMGWLLILITSWMNLRGIRPTEGCHSQKVTYCRILFLRRWNGEKDDSKLIGASLATDGTIICRDLYIR